MTGAIVVVGIVVGCAVALGRGAGPPPSTSKVDVVAGTNVWGRLAAEIGAGHVRVRSILNDPSADPHLYESDAATSSAVASADLVIANGLGYDDFINRLVAASPNGNRRVLTVADVLGASGPDANPHLWYDLPRAAEVAAKIADELTALDPDHAHSYRANLAVFDRSMRAPLALLATMRRDHGGTPVAYTERLPGLLLADLGFVVKTPSGFATSVEDGDTPSAQDVAAMNQLVTDRDIDALLYNAQATSPATAQLRRSTERAGIPIVALTETIPASETGFASWQLHQLAALQRVLTQ